MEMELRKILNENPDLPVMFFVSEETNQGDYGYISAEITSVNIVEQALYNNEKWMNEEDYESELFEDLSCENEKLSNDELWKLVEAEMKNVEFKKYITVYLG